MWSYLRLYLCLIFPCFLPHYSVSPLDQATKRHLTQRIENVDGKLDDQLEMSKLLRNEVQICSNTSVFICVGFIFSDPCRITLNLYFSSNSVSAQYSCHNQVKTLFCNRLMMCVVIYLKLVVIWMNYREWFLVW